MGVGDREMDLTWTVHYCYMIRYQLLVCVGQLVLDLTCRLDTSEKYKSGGRVFSQVGGAYRQHWDVHSESLVS